MELAWGGICDQNVHWCEFCACPYKVKKNGVDIIINITEAVKIIQSILSPFYFRLLNNLWFFIHAVMLFPHKKYKTFEYIINTSNM